MKLEFEVSKIVVRTSEDGTDQVQLYTDLGLPYTFVFHTTERLVLEFEASRDYGVEYVRSNFPGVPVEVVER